MSSVCGLLMAGSSGSKSRVDVCAQMVRGLSREYSFLSLGSQTLFLSLHAPGQAGDAVEHVTGNYVPMAAVDESAGTTAWRQCHFTAAMFHG